MAQRLFSVVASSLRGMQGVQSALVTELNSGRSVATSISGSMYSQVCIRDACSAAAPAQVSWRQRMHGHMPEFALPDRAEANPKTLKVARNRLRRWHSAAAEALLRMPRRRPERQSLWAEN